MDPRRPVCALHGGAGIFRTESVADRVGQLRRAVVRRRSRHIQGVAGGFAGGGGRETGTSPRGALWPGRGLAEPAGELWRFAGIVADPGRAVVDSDADGPGGGGPGEDRGKQPSATRAGEATGGG